MQRSEGDHRHGPHDSYWAGRTNFVYYRYVDLLVRGLAADADSLIDVGSADARYVESFDWIPKRHTLDISKPYSSENVEGIEMDFFDFEPEEKYDFATCLQVLEHIPDAEAFAQKLFQTAHRVLISVPYRWEEGSSAEHVHDPVDLDKLTSWTGREPDYHLVVREPLRKKRRLISYYHTEGEKLSLREGRLNIMALSARHDAAPVAPGERTGQSGEGRVFHRDAEAAEQQAARLAEELEQERDRNLALSKRHETLKERYEQATRERDRLNRLYTAVTQSNSWIYTRPLRKFFGMLRSRTRRKSKASINKRA